MSLPCEEKRGAAFLAPLDTVTSLCAGASLPRQVSVGSDYALKGVRLLHLYYGDGKGKTTAAFGLALRALGAGMRACVVQFLKDGSSSEARLFSGLPGATILACPSGVTFTRLMSDADRGLVREQHDHGLRNAIDLLRSGSVGLLVLDEAIDALNADLLDRGLLQEALDLAKRQDVEVVVTGHRKKGTPTEAESDDPFKWLHDQADYVTEMRCERHPYAMGVAARRGIEF